MPQHVHGDAAGEVDQFSPALIPYSRTLATHRNEGGWSESGDNDLVEIGTFYRGVRGGHQDSPAMHHEWERKRPTVAGRIDRSLNAGMAGMSVDRKILFQFSRNAAGPAQWPGPGFPAGPCGPCAWCSCAQSC